MQACLELGNEPIQRGCQLVVVPFSLLLLDKQMPVMDGHECATIARQRGFVAPIVGVTGNALNEQRQDFIAHGATEVIAKPLSKDVLIGVLRRHLNWQPS